MRSTLTDLVGLSHCVKGLAPMQGGKVTEIAKRTQDKRVVTQTMKAKSY